MDTLKRVVPYENPAYLKASDLVISDHQEHLRLLPRLKGKAGNSIDEFVAIAKARLSELGREFP